MVPCWSSEILVISPVTFCLGKKLWVIFQYLLLHISEIRPSEDIKSSNPNQTLISNNTHSPVFPGNINWMGSFTFPFWTHYRCIRVPFSNLFLRKRNIRANLDTVGATNQKATVLPPFSIFILSSRPKISDWKWKKYFLPFCGGPSWTLWQWEHWLLQWWRWQSRKGRSTTIFFLVGIWCPMHGPSWSPGFW